ncbi:MAG: nickel-dependent lactate racemase [Thermoplasmatales archaeon]|nr:MAG: nickel-dependent lactate racemase [Thermoplasmatales archaeon]
MEVKIPYGKENIKVKVPEKCKILVPKKVKTKDENKLIEEALENPLGYESYDEFAEDTDKLLVIINDATKPTPTSKILKYLLPVLSSHPDIKFLIATGSHRAPSEEECRFIFGDTYEIFRRKTYVHNAKKDDEMTYFGKSKYGTEIYINKLVPEYKNILVIGSVEPHYFAGYTGGRKSFLPGVASYKTIEMNHKFALSDDACSLVLNNNPVNEDMVDAINFLKDLNVFSIQTVLTNDHKLFAITAGDIHKSFYAAIKYSKQIFSVPLKQKGNIVISAVPYPMDINLYQSQNALQNGKLALEDDGIIILVSKCRTGIGEDVFLKLLCKADSPKKIFDIINKEYKLGYHKVAKMAQIGIKADMWAVTDLDEDVVRKAMFKPYSDIQIAVNDAINITKSKGKEPKVVVMPFGSLTVPNYLK